VVRDRIKRLVFDNDGVNIDSEDVAMQVMDDFGYDLVKRFAPDADLDRGYIYKTYPGTSTDQIIRALIKKYDLPEILIRQDHDIPESDDVSVFLADIVTIKTNERFQANLTCVPGVPAALKMVRGIYGPENIALSTTSRADRMDVSLSHATDPETGLNAGLDELFPAGSRRRSGYGHANKYDESIPALGWNPEEIAVIEDSLSGVSKAKAHSADIRVVGTVAARFYTDKEAQAKALLDAGASLVISDMRDLSVALDWLNADMDPIVMPTFRGKVYTPYPNLNVPVLKPEIK
jgi:beta-phosphoglucomutase-like phosphatase (HAD superfamily)